LKQSDLFSFVPLCYSIFCEVVKLLPSHESTLVTEVIIFPFLFLFLFLISYIVSVENPGYYKTHNILLLISDNKSDG